MSKSRILIVEDSSALALTYAEFLGKGGHTHVVAGTAAGAENFLKHDSFGAILLDLNLPDMSGIDFLGKIRGRGIETPVIIITADSSVESAVIAMRSGAEDFLSKPLAPERLLLTLKNVLERHALRRIVDDLRAGDRDRFCDFIGGSPAMQVVYRILENAAQSRAPVFITGESGTGKELAARAIHQLSQRKQKTFEALNCAAIPGNLLESEIFGHAKGAFTGAISAYTGAAERAHEGTLFLDELGEMPIEMQSKLLRFTQSGSFRPVGAAREVAVDVRFVSATNRDPLFSVREGTLREDLYYRLNVIPVHLPPLRERGNDIVMIADTILKRMAMEENKRFSRIAPEAAEALESFSWPGNVRQLQNVLRRAVVMHDGEVLTRAMLPVFDETVPADTRHSPVAGEVSNDVVTLRDMERQAIEHAISFCDGNITEAARRLGLNPSTLHRKRSKWRKSS